MDKYLKIKWISSLSLLLILINCTNPGEAPNNHSDKKIVQFEEQWVQPPPNFDTSMLSSVTEFNHKGKPVEKLQYSKDDGSLLLRTKWVYDDHFNETVKTTESSNANGIFEENYSYEYDKKGRKIRMLEKSARNKGDLEHIYAYHEGGNYTDTIKIGAQLLSISEYNKDDKIIHGENFQQQSTVNYEYDEFGNYTKHKTFYENGPGDVINYNNYYDSLGNLIRKTLDHRYREYEYNENGDVIKESRMDNANPTMIIIYKYKYFD